MSKPSVRHESCAYVVGRDLIQCDYDYPGAASRLGWSTARVQVRDGRPVDLGRISRARLADGRDCAHHGTDGTVDCRDCGCTASAFIASAGRCLDSHATY